MAKGGVHAEAEVDKHPDRNLIYQKGSSPNTPGDRAIVCNCLTTCAVQPESR